MYGFKFLTYVFYLSIYCHKMYILLNSYLIIFYKIILCNILYISYVYLIVSNAIPTFLKLCKFIVMWKPGEDQKVIYGE